jgi:uncharacterized protein (TIGR02996 family)
MSTSPAGQRAVLVENILENPGDPALRLAFADWLDQHGESGAGLLRQGGVFVWRDDWKFATVAWRVTAAVGEADPEYLLWSGRCEGGRKKCRRCHSQPKRSVGQDGVVATFVPGEGWLCPLCARGDGPKRFTRAEQRAVADRLSTFLQQLKPAARPRRKKGK